MAIYNLNLKNMGLNLGCSIIIYIYISNMPARTAIYIPYIK
jgi:hypothetical protein